MLTDLSFIGEGRQWPPAQERERLERYAANRKLFEGQHADIYAGQLERIRRAAMEEGADCSFAVAPNYQRLISLKTADLLAGEPPQITCADREKGERLEALLGRIGFPLLLYQAALDMSRYGDALLTVRRGEDGRADMGLGQPSTWFPVVSPEDIKKIEKHVVAWTERNPEDPYHAKLHVQVHERGFYTQSLYALAGGMIGRKLAQDRTVTTGIRGFAVIPLQAVTTSDSVYGCDDYLPIDSIVSEIMVVSGNISRILDKHASPSMQGPSGALCDDGQGGYLVRAGNFFVRDDASEPEVSYITWDGQLHSAFEHLRLLHEQLYVLSEMGEAILGSGGQAGVTTFRGLKLRMTSALCKTRRIAANIDRSLREALCLALQADGTDIGPEELSVCWYDGLPDDATEEVQRILLENGGKATMSHLKSIKLAGRLTDRQAEDEYKRIVEEGEQ